MKIWQEAKVVDEEGKVTTLAECDDFSGRRRRLRLRRMRRLRRKMRKMRFAKKHVHYLRY